MLVVSGGEYTDHIPGLVLAVPLTTRDRGLPHHVPVGGATTGLQESTWALCEQVRAISADQLRKPSGTCDEETVAAVRKILRRFLAL
ncbi:mRNA interferase MazF [Saccharopolyspora lacisalsi]|uniref:mRNA interferase MazF n=1 Tax=Halosaccharopolyspora lacisalsi TaxID=1000566 RepID=A0A839E0X5_9PSEU|nr:mRNA interferase MazF [Halosaccharopolyspora lacisalsi]